MVGHGLVVAAVGLGLGLSMLGWQGMLVLTFLSPALSVPGHQSLTRAACSRARTSSIISCLPAWTMCWILSGSADTPAPEKILPTHFTSGLPIVVLASFKVAPFLFTLSRMAALFGD